MSVCRKPWEKVVQIWLNLHHAVIFISNVQIPASVQNKLIVDLNFNSHDCGINKIWGKFNGFWQTDMVEFVID